MYGYTAPLGDYHLQFKTQSVTRYLTIRLMCFHGMFFFINLIANCLQNPVACRFIPWEIYHLLNIWLRNINLFPAGSYLALIANLWINQPIDLYSCSSWFSSIISYEVGQKIDFANLASVFRTAKLYPALFNSYIGTYLYKFHCNLLFICKILKSGWLLKEIIE